MPTRRKPDFKSFANCPDPKLITGPKTFASQNISGIFPGKVISVANGKLSAEIVQATLRH